MEFSNSQAIKYILTTFKDDKGNKLYDSTFSLRAPFKPNENGQYKVTINECLFQNNEPTLIKNEDYMEFTIYLKDGTEFRWAFTVLKDLYTFDSRSITNMLSYINYDSLSENIDKIEENESFLDISRITLYNSEQPEIPLTDYYSQNVMMSVFFDEIPGKSKTFKDITKVKLKTSTNYAYLLNDFRNEIWGEKYVSSDPKKCCFNFKFHNLRLGGPYLYVLKTPLRATVPTYNANNQGYNIVACTYNTNGYHNMNTQMCSSMELVTNDLSNFRIELVNDQLEHVRIKTPLYLQITVSNC